METQQQGNLINLKYKDLGSFEFNQVITKIANTPTTAAKADAIRKLVKKVWDARKFMEEQYKADILGTYFQKDEKGEYLKAADGQDYLPVEGKEAEIMKANDDFGQRVYAISLENVRPLTASTIADVKVSAREIELLNALYTDSEGPGLPHNVAPFPGKNSPQQ